MKSLLAAVLTAAIIALTGLTGCRRSPAYRTMDGGVWNTTYHIIYKASDNLDHEVLEAMNEIDQSVSAFNPCGLLWAINSGDTTVRADSLLRRVWAGAERVWEASEGRFDPTLGPAIKLWGFGPGHDTVSVTGAMIDSVRALTGFGRCAIMPDGRIVKPQAATEFNFSAIAKGLGCDLVAERLERCGVTDYMVEIGGEIVASGLNDRGQPWRIMIDSPRSGQSGHQGMAYVAPGGRFALATSGNYRNYRTIEGRGRIGHTIDARTCLPAEQKIAAVTVSAPDCMTADALATACMTAGEDEARRLIARFPGTGCLLVTTLSDSVKIYGDFPLLR